MSASKFSWTWTPLHDLTEEYCDLNFVLRYIRSSLVPTKVFEKNMIFDFTINLNFAFEFFNFLFYSK